jgi:hypothetical protein
MSRKLYDRVLDAMEILAEDYDHSRECAICTIGLWTRLKERGVKVGPLQGYKMRKRWYSFLQEGGDPQALLEEVNSY